MDAIPVTIGAIFIKRISPWVRLPVILRDLDNRDSTYYVSESLSGSDTAPGSRGLGSPSSPEVSPRAAPTGGRGGEPAGTERGGAAPT